MNFTTDLQVTDSVEYVDPDSGWHHVGIVMAVDLGSGWSEVRILVQWADMNPTWVRASLLSLLERAR